MQGPSGGGWGGVGGVRGAVEGPGNLTSNFEAQSFLSHTTLLLNFGNILLWFSHYKNKIHDPHLRVKARLHLWANYGLPANSVSKFWCNI